MDLRKVKKLIELAEEADIAELEVTSGDESVRIRMNGHGMIHEAVSTTPALPAEKIAAPIASPTPAGKRIQAPMAGTFYRAPSPETSAYVDIGQDISAGDVVCIIESMKMMHEIRAAEGGTITTIPVDNGSPISTGEVLFVLS